MKILMLEHQRKYFGHGRGYKGFWNEELFREEVARQFDDVSFYGWGYDPEWDTLTVEQKSSIVHAIEKYGKPDVVMSPYSMRWFSDYDDIDDDILRVHTAGDFYDGNRRFGKYCNYFKYIRHDVVCAPTLLALKTLNEYNIRGRKYLLPWGFDSYFHRNLDMQKSIDVSAFYNVKPLGNRLEIFPFRIKIQEMLSEMEGLVVELHKHLYLEYVMKINQSKIFINSNAGYKFINPRVNEVMSCGTFLITDRNDEFRQLGYEDGKHLVLFDNLDDLKEKILYYLENEKEREEIASNGMKFVRSHFSNRHRVMRLKEIMEENL
jgi:spore maturation protein CgeB